MQAIRTKHVPATDTKPARIQAKCEARTIYVSSYPDDLDSIEQRHSYAAAQLVRKMGWHPPHGRYAPLVGGYFDGAFYRVFSDDTRCEVTDSPIPKIPAAV